VIPPDLRPVFIGGCPRSGTRHLGAILGAHPECVCVPESSFKTAALAATSELADPRDLVGSFLDTLEFQRWGLDAHLLRKELQAAELTYPQALLHLVRRYADSVHRSVARVWIDHTPSNVHSAVTLSEMFPAARFLHIVRDGRGVAASVLPLSWGPNTIERAAHWWTEQLAFGLAQESWDRTRVMRVHYEDLVMRPEQVVASIADFCGLAFEPAMLRGDGIALPRDPGRRRRTTLVGRPSEPSRATAWEHTLSARQIESFESVAADLLRYLGYTLRFGPRARATSRTERIRFAIYETYRERLRNPHQHRRERRRRARGG
jgi:hypothetical protein